MVERILEAISADELTDVYFADSLDDFFAVGVTDLIVDNLEDECIDDRGETFDEE